MTTTWDLDNLIIRHGNHAAPNGEVRACAMEAAYLRWAAKQGLDKRATIDGWTDRLACVCPVIGAFVRRWNDNISSDEVRTRIFTPDLLDLLPDTKGTDVLLLRRMWMAIDWDIRTRTPALLRLAKLDTCADALASLSEILSQEDLNNARAICADVKKQAAAAGAAAAARDAAGAAAWAAARDAAGAAAWAAARDAAGAAAWAAARDAAGAAAAAGDAAWAAAGDAAGAAAAAWDAAGAAARAAARDAAGAAARAAARDAAGAAARDAAGAAAWAAARDAAGDAAGAAAWAAARDAAGDALKTTVEALQASAVDLLRRMCALRSSP